MDNIPLVDYSSTKDTLLMNRFKPKHPRMYHIERRLLSYEGWFITFLTPKEMAECGFYFTEIPDIVTCFFCNLRIGNWKVGMNPINEHEKNNPDCEFLKTVKEIKEMSANKKILSKGLELSQLNLRDFLNLEIIEEGLEYFTESLLKQISFSYLRKYGVKIQTFSVLCNEVMQFLKQRKNFNYEANNLYLFSENEIPSLNTTSFYMMKNENVLRCKICMIKDIEILFQPCGHIVSCYSCAVKLSNCPICRIFINEIIKAYHS